MGPGNARASWIWGGVSTAVPHIRTTSATLYDTWRDEWQGLGSSQDSADRISKAIEDDRQAVLVALTSLHRQTRPRHAGLQSAGTRQKQ